MMSINQRIDRSVTLSTWFIDIELLIDWIGCINQGEISHRFAVGVEATRQPITDFSSVAIPQRHGVENSQSALNFQFKNPVECGAIFTRFFFPIVALLFLNLAPLS